MTAVVEARGLTKRWRGLPGPPHAALDGLDLRVDAGEGVVLLGPNGAGKSTLLWMIAGLRRPTAGQLAVRGRAPTDPAARQGLGLLPERPALPPGQTVREVLTLHARLIGERSDAVDPLLDRLALGGRAQDRTHTLSTGLRQRVALAVALLGQPSLLLLDEPLANLDPASVERVRAVLTEERERGITLLLATHRLAEVAELCDRVVHLAAGTAQELGAPGEVLARMDSRVVFRAPQPVDADDPGPERPVRSRVVAEGEREALVARILAAGGAVLRVEPLVHRLAAGGAERP